jgi:hypothetical protein
MTTEIWMTIGLFFTTFLSIVMVWYVRKVLLKLYMLQEVHNTAFERIDSFKEHVEKIHELEMFYGDETLQGMIQHSKELSEYLAGLSNSVMFSYEDEEDEEEIEEQDD